MAGQQQHRTYVRTEFNGRTTATQSLCKGRIQQDGNSETESM